MGKHIEALVAFFAVIVLDLVCIQAWPAAVVHSPAASPGVVAGLAAAAGLPPWAPLVLAAAALGPVVWWARRYRFPAAAAVGIGLWLAGALGSLVQPLLGFRICAPWVLPAPPGFTVDVYDLAYLGGLLLVLGAAVIPPLLTPRRALLPLAVPEPPLPDLGGFARGIDNLRIDVHLSPGFCNATRRLLSALLNHEMMRDREGKAPAAPAKEAFLELRELYRELLTATVRRAKRRGGLPQVALLQVAVLKYLRVETRRCFDATLGQLRARLQGSEDRRNPMKLLYYEQLFRLAKSRAEVEARVLRGFYEQLAAVERGSGAELRRSLFGEAWALRPEAMFNPLLQVGDPGDRDTLLRRYVLLGQRGEERREIEQLMALVESFAPAQEQPQPVAWQQDPDWLACADAVDWPGGRRGSGYDWTALPDNLALLLDAGAEAVAGGRDAAEQQRLRRHRRRQRADLDRLVKYCRRRGLLHRFVAAYEMVPVFDTHYRGINPLLVYQYLVGEDRGNTLRQIRRAGGDERELPRRPLLRLAARVRRQARRQPHQYVLRYIRDLYTYRRDLLLYCAIGAAMEQVHLVEEASELRLSRANRCLHEIGLEAEAPTVSEQVKGHVIVKADLRGSTTVTRELLEQRLNPATHFDRHFFAPVNDVLAGFGAEKVFVEGDAVIAALLEYEGEPGQMVVARACGVARKLLDIVRLHNRVSEQEKLPPLQVGIGIAYQPEPPSYLFEGEHPIMISPAIGRADRLSSSSWRLRKEQAPATGARVLVYELEPDHPMRGEKGETDLRYNVMGVELEDAGYQQLARELRLSELPLPGGGRWLAARFNDPQGTPHRLLLRCGVVYYYGSGGPGADTGRRYYEVVTDPDLLAQADRALKVLEGAG